MSEKAQAILEKVAAFPEKLQDKFLDKLDGAAMYADVMSETGKEEADNGSNSPEPH